MLRSAPPPPPPPHLRSTMARVGLRWIRTWRSLSHDLPNLARSDANDAVLQSAVLSAFNGGDGAQEVYDFAPWPPSQPER